MGRPELLPVAAGSSSEDEAVPAGAGRSLVRYWVAGLALAAVLVAAVSLSARGGISGPGPHVAEVGDSIAMSHFSQTKSYKCNKKYAEDRVMCDTGSSTPGPLGNSRRLLSAETTSTPPSDDDDESDDEYETRVIEMCKIKAGDEYKECCSSMSGGRCSYPCTEVCMQQYGTITKDYKDCCKRCPGGECVDPWALLKNVYED